MARAGAAARPYPGSAPWSPNAARAAYFATKGSDYISFADPPRIIGNSTDFCFEVVIRPRAAMDFYYVPVSKHSLTQGVYFSTDNPATKVLFAIDDVDVGLSFPLASAGEARYYCANYVGSTLYGYSAPYDGTQTQALSTVGTAFPAAPTTTSSALEIGGLSAQAGFGVGYVGEVLWFRWWNKGLDNDTLYRMWNRRLIPGEKPPKDLAFWWDAAAPRRDLVSGQIGTINGTVAFSSTYGYPKYFISTRDRRNNWLLTSIEAGSTAATATGGPALPFFNTAGTAAQTHAATGAPNLPRLNAAGVAVQTQAATGTPSLPFMNAAGAAVTGAYSATGTPSLPFLSAAGVAVQTQAATGTPSLPFMNAAGVAVMLPSSTGAASLPFMNAAGAALHTQAATGTPSLPFMSATGTAIFGSAATATGAPSLPFLSAAGTAAQAQTASGTPSLPFMSAAGVAVFGSAAVGSGTPSLPFVSASGAATQAQAATGTPSLPFLSAAGMAVLAPRATGTPSLPFMSASGAATVRHTATGTPSLPFMSAAGSAFFGDALGVIASALARWAPEATASARWSIIAEAQARNE